MQKNKYYKIYKRVLFIMVLIISSTVYSQTVEGVLLKIKDKYSKQNNYKFNVTYTLYRGKNSNEKLSEYKGVVISTKNMSYNKTHKTETFITDRYVLRVSEEEKVILYTKDKAIISKNQKYNFLQILDVLTPVKVTSNDYDFICELLPKENTSFPYSKIFLIVDKQTYRIKKQILYLSKQINFSTNENKDDFDLVRLEIISDNIQKVTSSDNKTIDISQFVIIGNTKVQLTDKYRAYQLILNN